VDLAQFDIEAGLGLTAVVTGDDDTLTPVSLALR
jgi:hypothetical protein